MPLAHVENGTFDISVIIEALNNRYGWYSDIISSFTVRQRTGVAFSR